MSIKFLDLPPGPAPPGPAPPSKTSEASEPPPTSKKNFSFFFGQNH